MNHRRTAVHYELKMRAGSSTADTVTRLLAGGAPLLGTELHYPVLTRNVEITALLIAGRSPLNVQFPFNEYSGPKTGDTPLTLAVSAQRSDLDDLP